MVGWTRARLARSGWFAALFAAAAFAYLVAYAMPWFTSASLGTVTGSTVAPAVSAVAPQGFGQVAAAAPAVPTVAGVPTVTVALVAAALLALAAIAGRNAVLFVPAGLMWLVGSVFGSVTSRALSWAPVGPSVPGAGWQVMSVTSTVLVAAMVVAAVWVARVNYTVRVAAGAGAGAALAGMETVLLRGAATRGDAAGSQAAMAAQRTDGT